MNVSIGIITETWLWEGSGLQEDVNHFVNGTGFGLLNLCQTPNHREVVLSGVSITFRKNTCELNQIKLSNHLVRVAPDCNRSYCEDSFSGYSGSV